MFYSVQVINKRGDTTVLVALVALVMLLFQLRVRKHLPKPRRLPHCVTCPELRSRLPRASVMIFTIVHGLAWKLCSAHGATSSAFGRQSFRLLGFCVTGTKHLSPDRCCLFEQSLSLACLISSLEHQPYVFFGVRDKRGGLGLVPRP